MFLFGLTYFGQTEGKLKYVAVRLPLQVRITVILFLIIVNVIKGVVYVLQHRQHFKLLSQWVFPTSYVLVQISLLNNLYNYY